MRRVIKPCLIAMGVYLLAWTGYVIKSAVGIDVLHDGVHHGPIFPGSDSVVSWLRHR